MPCFTGKELETLEILKHIGVDSGLFYKCQYGFRPERSTESEYKHVLVFSLTLQDLSIIYGGVVSSDN